MENRPRFRPPLTPADRALEASCLIVLVLLWAGTITAHAWLPQVIPVHFNGAGEADRYGPRSSIFTLPVVATVIYAGITALNRFPHIFNYAAQITPENAHRHYAGATRMMRMLKLGVLLVFSGIVWMTCRTAWSSSGGPGAWALPLMIAIMLAPTAWLLIRSRRRTPTR